MYLLLLPFFFYLFHPFWQYSLVKARAHTSASPCQRVSQSIYLKTFLFKGMTTFFMNISKLRFMDIPRINFRVSALRNRYVLNIGFLASNNTKILYLF